MERYIKKQFNLLFLTLFVTLSTTMFAGAQSLQEEIEKAKQNYPDEFAVFNKMAVSVQIKMKDGIPHVSANYIEEILHLNKQSNVLARDKVYTNSFEDLGNITAYTEIPHKNRSKKVTVSEFNESFDRGSSVFFDDTKTINFIYPAVDEGVKTVIQYSKELNEARFAPGFFFQRYLPVLESSYIVTVEEGISVNFDKKNLLDYGISVKEEHIKGATKYSFVGYNLDKFKTEDNSPNVKYFAPHVNLVISSYVGKDGKEQSFLGNTGDLYDWYKEFIVDLIGVEDTALKTLALEITEGINEEKEKVRAVFYWVQNNIKYIAFEDGMRGFIPHNGAYVCEKRYGDCKDMASLLVSLLYQLGIEANFTWVGTRDIPYKYSEFASPNVDNHMIATYEAADKIYYLDATSQYSPFGYPSSMIQGKEVFISTQNGYKIETVPEINKTENKMVENSTIYLENGTVKGQGTTSLAGFSRVFTNYKLNTQSESAIQKTVEGILQRGNNKFNLTSYELINLYDLDSNLIVKFEFEIPNYYQQIGDEIYINLNLDKSYNNDIIEKERETSVENEYKYLFTSTQRFKIPIEYSLNSLPKDHFWKDDKFGFSIKYEIKDDLIVMKKELYFNFLLLNKSNFQEWNDFIKSLGRAYSESVILKKKI